MGALDPHPALKAIVPMASPADMWIGDDFHHNGAFRLSYGLEYAYMMESSKEMTPPATLIDRYDTYDWYLELGPLSNANRRYFRESLPTWNDFVRHPDYDAFWKRQAFAPWLNRVTVPTLNVAGWWDQEDFYGPIKIYELLEKHDTKSENFLVVGPWNHGGWSRGTGRTLGRIDFGSDTATHYRRNVMATFLAHYLKDQGAPPASEALTFRTGANEWTQHDAWPPVKNVTPRRLYFQEDGKLAFTAPPAAKDDAFDSYLSDPHSPVPYRPRPITLGRGWSTWLVEDQRFVHGRPDVRTYVDRSADRAGRRLGTDRRAPVCRHQRHRQRLDREADRRLSREARRRDDARVSADDCRRRDPRAVSQEHRAAHRADAERPGRVRDSVSRQRSRVSSRAPHHGAGAEHLVPGHRSEPAEIRAEHFPAQPADFIAATQRIFRSGAQASHIVLPVSCRAGAADRGITSRPRPD